MGYHTSWWTTQGGEEFYAGRRFLVFANVNLADDHYYKQLGLSVRCLKKETLPAQPSEIIGETTVCENQTDLVYQVNQESDYTYNWTIPEGWEIISGNGTNAITINVGNQPGTVSVVAINYLGQSPERTLNINISVPNINIQTNSPICEGNNIELSLNNGISWSWSGPDDFESNEQNPTIESATTQNQGEYTIIVSDEYGCSASESVYFTIYETPLVESLDNVETCISYVLPELSSGTYYTESGGSGDMLNAGYEIENSQTIYILVETGTEPNCFAESEFTVTINPLPTIPISADFSSTENEITWNWENSQHATGYKYNTTNDYSTAIDIGNTTSFVQDGFEWQCGTPYSLFIWAYNDCGHSEAVILYGGTSLLYEGELYRTIQVGNHCWFAENLKYLPEVHPPDYCPDSLPAYYIYGYYGNDINEAKQHTENNINVYNNFGVLYNQEAAFSACPQDWHLASDLEWRQLEMEIGMTETQANFLDWRGSNEGGKLKHQGLEFWNSPNVGATNEIGFNALPGGFVNGDHEFYGIFNHANWWTGTYGTYRELNSYNETIWRGYTHNLINGKAARCIKDYNLPQPPICPEAASVNYHGYTYATVKIGNQCWLAENLKYLPQVNNPEDLSASEPKYYVYGYNGTNIAEAQSFEINEQDIYNTYGVLYNWEAAINACPPGWKLPSHNDWTDLEREICVSPDCNSQFPYNMTLENLTGTWEGAKLRSTELWHLPDIGTTNEVFFNALPAGTLDDEVGFGNIGNIGGFWSSSEMGLYAFGRVLFFYEPQIIRLLIFKARSGSVRCIKE
jgi:uncharacterized protein (TIGR02145 family)